MKIQKKWEGGGARGEGSCWGGGGQGGCERRIEVFVKIQKKNKFGLGGGGVRVDVNEELKFLGKLKKKNWGEGGGGGGGRGGQGGCERRIKVFMKIQKKMGGGGGGGGSGEGSGRGGQGGCERRIEFLVKIKKKNQKKNWGCRGGGGGWVGGGGVGLGGGGQGGFE